ncbi:MAG TPA: EscU/YscU/HrcU family type III secretion system export apparatus switch protein [Anaeromyxobacter sp.]|nr:EscU/YscU/HrcU family type III secretion system export apparatus switch protein [Anaeromyxobacter sp.]
MSGASRTEPPTPRRLREARRRGEVARSAELTGAAALLGGLAATIATGPAAAAELARLVRGALAGAAGASPDPVATLREAAATALRLSLAPGLGALAAGALAGALQAGVGFFPGALRPRLERIDPLRGIRRLASTAHLLQVGLGLAKAAVLLVIAAAWLGESTALAALPRAAPGAALRALPALHALALRLAAAFAAFGALDWAIARHRHRRALMMTRDEVRREQKEDDGDPAHRAERRRRHRALLEAGPVSRATVVVVNPTHVAVALRHERGGEDAPRVVAKGTGLAAARIRSAARRAGVPIVRDLPLARALHRLAEVGDEIPEQLYEAAAAVLAHLYAAQEPSSP